MDSHIFPLLIGIKIQHLLVAVESQLIVHPVKQRSAGQCLAVLQRLTHPDDENIVLGDLFPIALVDMRIGVLYNSFLAQC